MIVLKGGVVFSKAARFSEDGVVSKDDNAAMTQTELIARSGERTAGYKVPRSIVVLDELPLNATGKGAEGPLR